MAKLEQMTDLERAAAEFRDRKNRNSHPAGKFDSGGRWYPATEERQDCCDGIRTPSRAYPYSLMTHCRTVGHVAKLFGVDVGALRKLIRSQTQIKREGGQKYYKIVARIENRLLSIFDGKTEYKIGCEICEQARQGHNGGFYAYSSAESAIKAPFPADSKLLHAPRVLIEVECGGSYCRYGSKISFSRITPRRIVREI